MNSQPDRVIHTIGVESIWASRKPHKLKISPLSGLKVADGYPYRARNRRHNLELHALRIVHDVLKYAYAYLEIVYNHHKNRH